MGKRILVVDDSASVRQVEQMVLSGAGYDVLEAQDGKDALRKLGDNPVALVLTDLNMPLLDGVGLIQQLRQHPAHRLTPIVMITTESSDEKKQAGRAAGATGWLVKPFDPAKLIEVIGKVIR